MPQTLLPDFATLSEFVAGLNGDCGPTATLAALNFVDPARWPLTPAALKALDTDEISHGFAEANGAQNIPSMSSYLDRIGVAHTTTGYDAFTLDALHATLKAQAGHKPIIVEWANAGALPGDEPGVHFHFSTCGGVDPGALGGFGGYLWCDGDNRADDPGGAPRPPVLYTWQQIQAAQPIAFIVIDAPRKEPQPVAIEIEKDAAGNVTGARDADNGKTLGAGFALVIEQQGWQSAHVRVEERTAPGTSVRIAVADAATMTFTPDHGVEFVNVPNIADSVAGLFAALDAADTQAQAAIAAQAQEESQEQQEESQEAAQPAPGVAEIAVPVLHAMGDKDTYQSIAAEYYGGDSSDAAVHRILAANGIPNDGVRFVGRVLVIPPAPVAASPAPETPAQ